MKTVIHMAAECMLFEELSPDEFEAALVRFAELARADERGAILPILKGIDETEIDSPDGWWETSSGAKFGAEILAAIRARGQK